MGDRQSVLIFLATRWSTVPHPHRRRSPHGNRLVRTAVLPRVGPSALYGLLFTIVVLFALQGSRITGHPLDVARVAVPLLMYFGIMWGGSFALGYRLWLPYERNASVAFTAAGNNFELAIAVSIAVFGVTSGQALAGTARSSRSPPSSLSSTSPCGPNDVYDPTRNRAHRRRPRR